MQDLLIGLAIGFIGLLLLSAGYRFARIVLPIWGFIAGFSLGASITADVAATGFLGSMFGIIVGFGVGLLFAVLIYAYYYLAVILLGATLGYWIGSGFIGLFGIEPGLLTTLTGLAVGTIFGIAGVAMNLPKVFLVTVTSVVGAMAAIGGILLAFNVIPLEFFSYQSVQFAVSNSFFWAICGIGLAVIGMVTQFATTNEYEMEEWGASEGHHTSTPHEPKPTHA